MISLYVVGMFSFTRQEQIIIVFLIASVLVGSGVIWYKRHHPGFAPELNLGPPAHVPSPLRLEGTEGEMMRSQDLRKLGGTININTATVEELQQLPGIGPTIASRIVEYRLTQGGFKSIEELTKVKGIGRKSLEKLRPYIRIE